MAIADALENAKGLSDQLWDGMHGLEVEGGLRERLSMRLPFPRAATC